MFEKTASHGFGASVALRHNLNDPSRVLKHALSSTLWSIRFAKACTQELRLVETQGQYHKLIEEDCLKRIFQRADSSQ